MSEDTMAAQQKIVTYLWFDREAEEAAQHYVSIFDDARITSVTRYGAGTPFPAGTAMTVQFQLEGQTFLALNGGPHFKFNEAISLLVNCESQAEVDALWARLTEGGAESQCGWLKDRYGLSWQIIPTRLMELLSDPDPGRAQRALQAMLQMQKIDVPTLERAAETAV
jgi:predicted 3-demethylubiquinone-9 3-methyltransferase (glyoxalase superfamily)